MCPVLVFFPSYLNKSFIFTSQNNFIYSVAQAKHYGLLTPLLSCLCHIYKANHVDATFKLYYSLHGQLLVHLMEATASAPIYFPFPMPWCLLSFSHPKTTAVLKNNKKTTTTTKKSKIVRIMLYYFIAPTDLAAFCFTQNITQILSCLKGSSQSDPQATV